MADTWPVVEVFGPTIQGEGPAAGQRAFFVRFGGCDYRCSWCDSLYAVTPELVRLADRLSTMDIVARLRDLGAVPNDIIVLSGGNPVMHDLAPLVDTLHDLRLDTHVETQGTVWRDWLTFGSLVVVSPKPPSSGMATGRVVGSGRDAITRAHFREHLWSRVPAAHTALKIVVGSDADYEWARDEIASWAGHVETAYLSALTPQGLTEAGVYDRGRTIVDDVSDSYRWLCERAAADVDIRRLGPIIVVLPQLHVVAWGSQRGR